MKAQLIPRNKKYIDIKYIYRYIFSSL